MKVETAKSWGGDQGVRVDEDGHHPDHGEADQEEGGDHRDCPLHQAAVGGEIGCQGYGNEDS